MTVSRIRRAGEAEVQLAAGGTVLKNGDHIVAVGTGAMLDRFQQVVGRRSDEDIVQAPGRRDLFAGRGANKRALGKSPGRRSSVSRGNS